MSRRAAIRVVGAGIVCLANFAAAAWMGGYRIKSTPSFPLGLWRIEVLERDAGDAMAKQNVAAQ